VARSTLRTSAARADDPGRNPHRNRAGRYVLANQGRGADDGVIADGDAVEDFRAGADPRALADAHSGRDARLRDDRLCRIREVVVTADGRATQIEVVKGPGLGLEEKAVDAVKQWRFKPALGPNGKPVATLVTIEVNFRLL